MDGYDIVDKNLQPWFTKQNRIFIVELYFHVELKLLIVWWDDQRKKSFSKQDLSVFCLLWKKIKHSLVCVAQKVCHQLWLTFFTTPNYLFIEIYKNLCLFQASVSIKHCIKYRKNARYLCPDSSQTSSILKYIRQADFYILETDFNDTFFFLISKKHIQHVTPNKATKCRFFVSVRVRIKQKAQEVLFNEL